MSKSGDRQDAGLYINDAIRSLEKALKLLSRPEEKKELQRIYESLDDFSIDFD